MSVPLLAGLAATLVIALVYVLGEVMAGAGAGAEVDGDGLSFGVALALVLLSSLLVVAAVLPPGVVARTPVPPASFARFREPLVLAAIGILVPVALFTLLIALT